MTDNLDAAEVRAWAERIKNQLAAVQLGRKKEIDDNQAETRMLVETGKHSLKEQGKGTDQANALELQKQAAATKAAQQTPEAQGFDRAAKGAFAKEDASVFGS